jgi:hypothetical protein
MHIDANGMKRTSVYPMYRKIPVKPIGRVAVALTEGSIKYDEGIYDRNWEKATPESAAENIDHVIWHILQFLAGDTSEDHLAHGAADLLFAMQYQDEGLFDPANPPVEEDVEGDAIEVEEPVPSTQTLLAKLQGLLKK